MKKCPACKNEVHERFCPWCGHDIKAALPMPGARVYVVQNQHKNTRVGERVPKFDLAPARKFGNLVYLLGPEDSPFQSERAIKALHRGLVSITREDHLLLLGNPCLIGWTVAVASHYLGGVLKLLQWEGKTKEYLPVTCDLQVSS